MGKNGIGQFFLIGFGMTFGIIGVRYLFANMFGSYQDRYGSAHSYDQNQYQERQYYGNQQGFGVDSLKDANFGGSYSNSNGGRTNL